MLAVLASASVTQRHRVGVRFLALIPVVMLIASACGNPAPTPTASNQTPVPTGALGPTPSALAGADAWRTVEQPALAAPIATLEATRRGDASVAVDTAFHLTSLDGTAASTLADRLTVEPAVTLRRSAGASADTITLTPGTALRNGQTYRFSLHRTDGSVAGAWSVLVAAPLRVVGTIPGHEMTEVPVKTGIEVTFDQGGVTAAALQDAFSITPRTAGRFEVHGRSVAFVPEEPLKALTLYTVTIGSGLPVAGTGETLHEDYVLRFETAGEAGPADALRFWDKLFDSATTARPVVIGTLEDESSAGQSKTVKISIHRLPTATAAADAYRTLVGVPTWTTSGDAPIPTAGLSLVDRATVTIDRSGDEAMTRIRLPKALDAGWYLVTVDHGQRHQVVVQSTDIAAYTMVTGTRTVVWANSVASGRPIRGATVRVADQPIGTTDADGLLIADTPEAMTSADGRIWFASVRVTGGQAVIVPLEGPQACGKCEGGFVDSASNDAYWVVLSVDRSEFRSTDHANVWGIVRARDGGRVPEDVEVRLQTASWDGRLPIVVERVSPSDTGMFTVSLALDDLPLDGYEIVLLADDATVATREIWVSRLIKPAWQLAVETDHRAILSGDSVRTTATATFFDGTPVGGVALSGSGGGDDEEDGQDYVTMQTGVDGVATGDITIRAVPDEDEGWMWSRVGVNPTLPEEADISGGTWVAVFMADALIEPSAQISGTSLVMTGLVTDVDWAAMDAVTDPDDDFDAAGAPLSGRQVRVSITERTPVRTRDGSAYDPITKQVEPSFDWTEKEVSLGARTVTTGADGRFRVVEKVRGGARSYDITFETTDAAGRTVRFDRTAIDASETLGEANDRAHLVVPGAAEDGWPAMTYTVGDQVTVEVRGGHPEPSTDRYLFTVAQRGLLDAAVQSGPTFSKRFPEAWVPNAQIRGVRFNGSFYEVPGQDATADVQAADYALKVAVTADAQRYEPGGRVNVAVRTTTPDGVPVGATVVVRTIDEKLFAMGAAESTDTLGVLYQAVGSGEIATAWSHAGGSRDDGSGDDTGGGGGDGRQDFRDWLLFRRLTTGPDGRATASFDLSDDLTSWRVLASAVDARLRAGDARVDIPVGLPFFAEAVTADTYLAGDQPVLRVRGFGDALRPGQPVTFVVSMPSLRMGPTTTTAAAFETATIGLPRLTAGDHELRIAASVGTGSSRHEDSLTRTLHVVATRVVQGMTRSATLSGPMSIKGGTTGATTVSLVDGGRGRVLPLLSSLMGPSGTRRDELLAGNLAGRVLTDVFGMPTGAPSSAAAEAFLEGSHYGIALVPYGSADLRLSALAALADDPAVNEGELAEYLEQAVTDEDSVTQTIEHLTTPTPTRERRIVGLAGLAALGEAVLPDIRVAADLPELTPIERSWLAVAAEAAGDVALATRLEHELIAEHGQRLGPWVRLSAPTTEESITTTAVLAIAAAEIGDPLAADMDAYLESNPPRDTLVVLERAIAARAWAERQPAAAASASLTVDGSTRQLDIAPGEPVWLTLTPAQVSSARLSPVSGSVVVTSSWEGPLQEGALDPAPVAEFSRTVSPSGTIPIDGLVTVTYTARLGPSADTGCWLLTDEVPSGLAPLTRPPYEDEEDEDDGDVGVAGPWGSRGSAWTSAWSGRGSRS